MVAHIFSTVSISFFLDNPYYIHTATVILLSLKIDFLICRSFLKLVKHCWKLKFLSVCVLPILQNQSFNFLLLKEQIGNYFLIKLLAVAANQYILTEVGTTVKYNGLLGAVVRIRCFGRGIHHPHSLCE